MTSVFVMLLGLLCLLLVVGGGVLWVWMLIDCAVNEPSEGNDKIVWVLIIVLTGPPGALVYLFVRRPTRLDRQGH
ncbi:MAG: hypothetical protein HN742_33635 [Lentisphaerae bacterium]|jgi:hypothetical protein|nr:hypothetical protein [Lentisphaerota bacterium]MBT4820845.1 hypothetical protein [Lentisphaerota bacterium]MBT5611405.1 hypothetical protein [Lentisphaerota bacterium]MBT7059633.1 hypothetical protein [Lentisphaerota bacterium]MBT7846862.1 hypothetical protein [Lentisphaerota bacterium]